MGFRQLSLVQYKFTLLLYFVIYSLETLFKQLLDFVVVSYVINILLRVSFGLGLLTGLV